MIKYKLTILLFLYSLVAHAQSEIIGHWKAIDDKDNQPSSHIEIFELNGKFHGKIVKLYDQPLDTVCKECKGAKKNQPVLGMEILWGMKLNDNSWTGGKIMDPENGSTYKCKLSLDDPNTLSVRGYIGIPALGRTQKWYRVE